MKRQGFMTRGGIKTALLIMLILGVIVQTGKLWFEESSGHSFFSSFLTARIRAPEEPYKIEPENIMVNLGNTRYIKLDVNAEDEIKTSSDELILLLIRRGKLIGVRPLSWSELLDRKSVLFEYPFSISTAEFTKSFGESGADFRSKVSEFDRLLIKPDRPSGEGTLVYVVDSPNDKMYEFEVPMGVTVTLSEQIDALRRTNREAQLSYISSMQNSLEFFSENIFLPEWHETEYSYSRPYVTNPLEEMGDLEKSVQFFFNNPVGLLSASDSAGIPFVSDKEAVVKYYANGGVLEYTNYGAQNVSQTSLGEAYAAARNFINRDLTLGNDVIMTGGQNENSVWNLYFDYSLDGMRVFLPPNDHAIEIAVSGGNVTKYRRVVRRIDRSELYGQLNESYIAVLDRALSDTNGGSGYEKLDDMQLGYAAEENGFREIAWFVEKDGVWSQE